MKVCSLIWTVIVLGVSAVSLPSCSPSNQTETASEAEPEVVREVTLSVPSVTCAACLASIRKEVINEPGVISMGGDPKTKVVVLRLSAGAPEDDGHLIEAIKRAGFEATVQ